MKRTFSAFLLCLMLIACSSGSSSLSRSNAISSSAVIPPQSTIAVDKKAFASHFAHFALETAPVLDPLNSTKDTFAPEDIKNLKDSLFECFTFLVVEYTYREGAQNNELFEEDQEGGMPAYYIPVARLQKTALDMFGVKLDFKRLQGMDPQIADLRYYRLDRPDYIGYQAVSAGRNVSIDVRRESLEKSIKIENNTISVTVEVGNIGIDWEKDPSSYSLLYQFEIADNGAFAPYRLVSIQRI